MKGPLQPNEVRLGLLIGVELEADDGVAVEGFGEAAQGVGAGAVLAALDAGDHRYRQARQKLEEEANAGLETLVAQLRRRS